MVYQFTNNTDFKTACLQWVNSGISALAENQHISTWDTSGVTNMSEAFKNATNFNDDISKWNTSIVTDMSEMFSGASNFNGGLNTTVSGVSPSQYLAWDTKNVINMSKMFLNAISFNKNISKWNTSKVTNMDQMFKGAETFNSTISTQYLEPFLKNITYFTYIAWNVSSVTNLNNIFNDCNTFNNGEIAGNSNNPLRWALNTSLTNLSSLFALNSGTGVYNQPINTENVKIYNELDGSELAYTAWDISNILTIEKIFKNQVLFNQTINNWDVSSVNDMKNALEGAISYNQSLDGWSVSHLTIAATADIFKNATTLINRNLPETMPPQFWSLFWGIKFTVRYESKSCFYNQYGNRISLIKTPVRIFNDGTTVPNIDTKQIPSWNLMKIQEDLLIHKYIADNISDLNFRFLYWEIEREVNSNNKPEVVKISVYENTNADDFSLKIQFHENELSSIGMLTDFQKNILMYNRPTHIPSEDETLSNIKANNIALDLSDLHNRIEDSTFDNCLITAKKGLSDGTISNVYWKRLSFKNSTFGYKFTGLLNFLADGYWRVPYELNGYRGIGPADSYYASVVAKAYDEFNPALNSNVFTNRFQFKSNGTFSIHLGSSGSILGNRDDIDRAFNGDNGLTIADYEGKMGEFDVKLMTAFKVPNGDYEDQYSLTFSDMTGETTRSVFETISFDSHGFLGFYNNGDKETYQIMGRSNDGMYLRHVNNDIAYYTKLVRAKEINIKITEVGYTNIEFGRSGETKKPPDWFEITNKGAIAITTSNWFYDNESADATKKSSFSTMGLVPEESGIFIVGWEEYYDSAEEAIEVFLQNWKLDGNKDIKVGYVTNGNGLNDNTADSIHIFMGNIELASIISYLRYEDSDISTNTFNDSSDNAGYLNLSNIKGSPGDITEIPVLPELPRDLERVTNKRYKLRTESRPIYDNSDKTWKVNNKTVLIITHKNNVTDINSSVTTNAQRSFDVNQFTDVHDINIEIDKDTNDTIDSYHKVIEEQKFKWKVGSLIICDAFFNTVEQPTNWDNDNAQIAYISEHVLEFGERYYIFEFDRTLGIIYVKENYGREHRTEDASGNLSNIINLDKDNGSFGLDNAGNPSPDHLTKLPGASGNGTLPGELNPGFIRRLNWWNDQSDKTSYPELTTHAEILATKPEWLIQNDTWEIQFYSAKKRDLFINMYNPTLFFSELHQSNFTHESVQYKNRYIEIFNPTNYNISLDYYFAFPDNVDTNNPTELDYWNMFPSGAVINSMDTYVIAHPDSHKTIKDRANHLSNRLGDNGNDLSEFKLVKGKRTAHSVLDVIKNTDVNGNSINFDMNKVYKRKGTLVEDTIGTKYFQGIYRGNQVWNENEWNVVPITSFNITDGKISNEELKGLGSHPNDYIEPIEKVVSVAVQLANEDNVKDRSIVNVLNINGSGKYVLNNGMEYETDTTNQLYYKLNNGTYMLENIPQTHPLTLLNNPSPYNSSVNMITIKPIDVEHIIIQVRGNGLYKDNFDDYFVFTDYKGDAIHIGDGTFKFMRGRTYRFENYGLSAEFKLWIPVKDDNDTYGQPDLVKKLEVKSNSANGFHTVSFHIPADIPVDLGKIYYTVGNDLNKKGNISLLYRSITLAGNTSNYDFYYGDVELNVNVPKDPSLDEYDYDVIDDFSIYCYYHGYMGGEHLLKFNEFSPEGNFNLSLFASDIQTVKFEKFVQSDTSVMDDTSVTPFTILNQYLPKITSNGSEYSLKSDEIEISVKTNPIPSIDMHVIYHITSINNNQVKLTDITLNNKNKIIQDLTVKFAKELGIIPSRLRITLSEGSITIKIELVDDTKEFYIKGSSYNVFYNEHINNITGSVSTLLQDLNSGSNIREKTKVREVNFDIYFSGNAFEILNKLWNNTYNPSNDAAINSVALPTKITLPFAIIEQLEDQYINSTYEREIRYYDTFNNLKSEEKEYLFKVIYILENPSINLQNKRLIIIRLKYQSYIIPQSVENLCTIDLNNNIVLEQNALLHLEKYSRGESDNMDFSKYYTDQYFYALGYIAAVKEDLSKQNIDVREIILQLRFGTYWPETTFAMEPTNVTLFNLDNFIYESMLVTILETTLNSIETKLETTLESNLNTDINTLSDYIIKEGDHLETFILNFGESTNSTYIALLDDNNDIIINSEMLLVGKVKNNSIANNYLDIRDDDGLNLIDIIKGDTQKEVSEFVMPNGENFLDYINQEGMDTLIEKNILVANEDNTVILVTNAVEADLTGLSSTDMTTLTTLTDLFTDLETDQTDTSKKSVDIPTATILKNLIVGDGSKTNDELSKHRRAVIKTLFQDNHAIKKIVIPQEYLELSESFNKQNVVIVRPETNEVFDFNELSASEGLLVVLNQGENVNIKLEDNLTVIFTRNDIAGVENYKITLGYGQQFSNVSIQTPSSNQGTFTDISTRGTLLPGDVVIFNGKSFNISSVEYGQSSPPTFSGWDYNQELNKYEKTIEVAYLDQINEEITSTKETNWMFSETTGNYINKTSQSAKTIHNVTWKETEQEHWPISDTIITLEIVLESTEEMISGKSPPRSTGILTIKVVSGTNSNIADTPVSPPPVTFTEAQLNIASSNWYYIGAGTPGTDYADGLTYATAKSWLQNQTSNGVNTSFDTYVADGTLKAWSWQTTGSLATGTGRLYFKTVQLYNTPGDNTSGILSGWVNGTNGYAHVKAGENPSSY